MLSTEFGNLFIDIESQMPRRKESTKRRIVSLNSRRNAQGQATSFNTALVEIQSSSSDADAALFRESIEVNEDDMLAGVFDPFEDDVWVESEMGAYFQLSWKDGADAQFRQKYVGTSRSTMKRANKKRLILKQAASTCHSMKEFLLLSSAPAILATNVTNFNNDEEENDEEEGEEISSEDETSEDEFRPKRHLLAFDSVRIKELKDEIISRSPLLKDKEMAHTSSISVAKLFKELCVGTYFEMMLLQSNKTKKSLSRVRIAASQLCAEKMFPTRKAISWKARRIRKWAEDYYRFQKISSSNRGKHSKVLSPLDIDNVKQDCLEFLREQNQNSLSSVTFHKFLLPYLSSRGYLAPGALLSNSTAQAWMHKLNFRMWDYKKGLYYDGHERPDVVEYRKLFLRNMLEYEARMIKYAHDETTEHETEIPPTLRPGEKTLVMVVHDECCFNCNDGKKRMWIEEGKGHLRKKGKGKSIMVSEFLCECHGHMRITADQARANNLDPMKLIARTIIHPGAKDDGYWTNEDVAKQLLEITIPIFNILHPPEQFQALFCFDNSSNHGSYSPDALTTTILNVSDGGSKIKDKVMRATTYNGIVQTMQTADGTQKGLKRILDERGIDTRNLSKADMVAILNRHDDFANQKPWLEEICNASSHLIAYFPKFHPELNWIERYWSNAKAFARSQCDYTFERLKVVVPQALDQVNVVTMRRFARKCFRYMDAYRLENNGAALTLKQVEWTVKKYKSHRRIPDSFDDIVTSYHKTVSNA